MPLICKLVPRVYHAENYTRVTPSHRYQSAWSSGHSPVTVTDLVEAIAGLL